MATVKCACGCGKRNSDKKMLYSVSAEEYYLNQIHKDKADGIIRDKEGFVIFERSESC